MLKPKTYYLPEHTIRRTALTAAAQGRAESALVNEAIVRLIAGNNAAESMPLDEDQIWGKEGNEN